MDCLTIASILLGNHGGFLEGDAQRCDPIAGRDEKDVIR